MIWWKGHDKETKKERLKECTACQGDKLENVIFKM
jgi:hypothetical protein